VQVAVPSRQDVEEYQNLRASVNELVGRINGRFGISLSLSMWSYMLEMLTRIERNRRIHANPLYTQIGLL
jgi:trehalose-6-phosphate synthase